MKLPKHEPAGTDRMATREELFQVLELLGGFESEATKIASTREQLECLEDDRDTYSEKLGDGTASEEELFGGIDGFKTSLPNKIERIN